MSAKVIAISGYKRSGKDATAEYLGKHYSFDRISFADPLKEMAAVEYGIDLVDFNNPLTKEAPIHRYPVEPKDGFSRTVAEFMFKEFVNDKGVHPDSFAYRDQNQFVGLFGTPGHYTQETLYHCPRSLAILKGSTNRVVSPNFWVHTAINKIGFDQHPPTTKGFVIPDLRYKSEIAGLKIFLPELITIRINRFDSVNSTDPSERDLDDYNGFSYTIQNKGTLEELYASIDKAMLELGLQKVQ